MNLMANDLLIALGLLAMLLISMEAGFRLGRRASVSVEARSIGQVGAVQGAILGLLGLLLAFSFAAAGGRFLERQDLIVTEANAIGTAFLRAGLLPEPSRTQLRSELKRYTEHRIAISRRLGQTVEPSALEEIDRMHVNIWRAASEGVKARPDLILAVLNPVNEVIDLHSLRMAAGRKHLPMLVLGLLIASSAGAVAVIGFGSGLGGSRNSFLTVPLALLIGTALWITVDLDHPRSGVLMLSDQPLEALSFEPPGD